MTKLLAALGLAAAAALAWWWASPVLWDPRALLGIHEGIAAVASGRYVTAPVEQGELRTIVSVTGTLNAIVNVEVGSQLSGQVAELLIDFNDTVKKGEPLARLDRRTFQARVDEAHAALETAEATVSVARAKLERARIDAVDSEAQRAILKARIDNARAKLEAARNELRRKEALRERQVGAAVEFEDARTRFASAEAALREAEAIAAAHENNVAGTKADLRRVEAELDATIATLPQKRAQLEVAQIDLDRTTIRSPIDGVVVGRNVSEGQTLATTLEAKTIFIIAGDLRQMEIDAKVDEADIGKIQVGQEATFTVDAHPGRPFTGAVRQIRKAPKVQQNVVTYTVVLSAANQDNLLLPGMTALVRIAVNQTGSVVKLPLAALRYVPKSGQAAAVEQAEVPRGRPASVWVEGEKGEPKAVVVGLGEDDARYAAVLSGSIAPGDRVIVGEVASPAPRRVFGIRVGL